ncbi:MAG: hypothetical protein IKP36_05155 [Bacteroidaceae bacterium]|nr:hypothetical protein [Bacteroidaceae bacterium]
MNFEQFTVDNGAIRDLNELLFTSVFNDPDLERVVTPMTKVENGKKLGYVDRMGDVGTAGAGCNPTYTDVEITGFEKTWALGDWEIPKSICYKDLEDTIARYGMHEGTERADLQDTPYWDKFLIPLLKSAINDMFWRLTWFGDTAAQNVEDGGNITDGIDVKLLKVCDGLWKRLETIIANNPAQQITIAANSEDTYAGQKAALRTQGVAIGIVDDLLSEADGRIFDKPDHAIFMTNSLFKALRTDVKNLHNIQLPVEKVMSGIQLSEYDGHAVLVLDIWDRMIKKYETIVTGTGNAAKTTLNCPHRAVLASPQNLFVGTSDKDRLASLTVKFDDRKRDNFIYAASNFGTLIGEDELVQVAI